MQELELCSFKEAGKHIRTGCRTNQRCFCSMVLEDRRLEVD